MRHCPQCPKVERWSIEDITWNNKHWQTWNTLKQILEITKQNNMLLIKPKGTRFHKQRLKSNLSFLRLSVVDQFMRLMKGSITGIKDCSWSINCSVVAVVLLQLFFQWCPLLLKLWGWPPKLDCLLIMQLLTHSLLT